MSVLPDTSQGLRAARELGDLLASIELSDNWHEVGATAQSLANALRNRGGQVDEHTILGKTMLPQTLTSLLKAALDGPRIDDSVRQLAVFELLRVGANLCMDHNDNRGHLLDAGFPQLVVTLLEGYSESLPATPSRQPLALSSSDLKIMKTSIGALLNLSLGYEPVQTRLISLEIPSTLLRLSVSIYPPGAWQAPESNAFLPDLMEDWTLRRVITDWTWRAIAGLKDNQAQQPLFGPESLPSLIAPLSAFIPPFPSASGTTYRNSKLQSLFFACDVEVLEEVSELLETLAMDVEDVRLTLARGMILNEEPPCLERLLDFIDMSEYVPGWNDPGIPSEEVTRWKGSVDLCKAAIIKAVVETTGEEKNLDILWDISSATNGFVVRMVRWLHDAKNSAVQAVRDDLIICATLSLGNLARKESHSLALLRPPISISPYLISHLTPSTDLKVKHGVIGLLKHLSQSSSNRPTLGKAGVIESLRTCQVFSDKADIAEIVQMSAVNLTKHLCTNNLDNAITCVVDVDENQPSSSCLIQILALSRRSDSIPVKSEGARVLVNVIKSLCSSTGNLQEERRQLAIRTVTTRESTDTLAQLLGRSKKHIILLNESILAMLLLSHQPGGAVLVLESLLTELPKEILPPSRQNSLNVDAPASNPSPVVSTITTALDMLVTILNNTENKFPVELRANLCTLLGELGKDGLKGECEQEVEKLRIATRQGLETAQVTPDSLVLSAAAKKALDAW